MQGFEFFGRVPREVWWDNPKTVAAAIFSGRQRQLHPRYRVLASHYVFEPLFCACRARGNEKPYVENRVKTLQRCWATPVPRQKDLAELNAYLACVLPEGSGTRLGREHRDDRCKRGFSVSVLKPLLPRVLTLAFISR